MHLLCLKKQRKQNSDTHAYALLDQVILVLLQLVLQVHRLRLVRPIDLLQPAQIPLGLAMLRPEGGELVQSSLVPRGVLASFGFLDCELERICAQEGRAGSDKEESFEPRPACALKLAPPWSHAQSVLFAEEKDCSP